MKQDTPILVRLRRQRRTAQRQIDKIKGKRTLIKWCFAEGEDWWASSDEFFLNDHLERVKEKEEWDSLSSDERNHRMLLKRGWRVATSLITKPN